MALRKDVLEDEARFDNQVSEVRNWLVERGEDEHDGWLLPPKARVVWSAKEKARQKSTSSETAGSPA